jgi:hypothetical protein
VLEINQSSGGSLNNCNPLSSSPPPLSHTSCTSWSKGGTGSSQSSGGLFYGVDIIELLKNKNKHMIMEGSMKIKKIVYNFIIKITVNNFDIP